MIGKNQLILILLSAAVSLSLIAVIWVRINNSKSAVVQDLPDETTAVKKSGNPDASENPGDTPDIITEEKTENRAGQITPISGGDNSNPKIISENNGSNNLPDNAGNNNNGSIAVGGSVSTKKIVCSDGTSAGQCSKNKPAYCDQEGRLMAECAQCGCPSGLQCVKEGDCLAANQTSGKCSDGTIIGKCSATKPKLCVDVEVGLTDACHSCGCPAGLTCGDDSQCH